MRVGLLTGGGDCPGLNAVIRAVVRKGERQYGDFVAIALLEGAEPLQCRTARRTPRRPELDQHDATGKLLLRELLSAEIGQLERKVPQRMRPVNNSNDAPAAGHGC